MAKRIRFGFQIRTEDESDPVAAARRAEEIGFDTFLVADHVGPGRSPMVTLAAVVTATWSIRLGTFALNSDMRNPVQLAWEASTLDHLSHGRFELGLGAGHTPHEYAETGIELRRAAERKQALAERVEIIRRLLDGETVTVDGDHHQLVDASIDRSHQERLPILVGGNGAGLLDHAGRHADIIGLQGLGRTKPDGHRHEVKWSTRCLDEQVAQVRNGADERFDELELNALVQIVDITDDAESSLQAVSERIGGLDVDELAQIPYVLIGTVDQIAEKVLACRDRWGISYFAVRSLDDFAPIIERVRQLDR